MRGLWEIAVAVGPEHTQRRLHFAKFSAGLPDPDHAPPEFGFSGNSTVKQHKRSLSGDLSIRNPAASGPSHRSLLRGTRGGFLLE